MSKEGDSEIAEKKDETGKEEGKNSTAERDAEVRKDVKGDTSSSSEDSQETSPTEDPNISDSSEDSWEYEWDPTSGVVSQSQACITKGGHSYTPEGWVRKYKKRRSPSESKAAKRIKLDD